MLSKLRKTISFVANPSKLHGLGQLGSQGYLAQNGWFKSFKDKLPMDAAGKPLPWFTYPSILFLNERLTKTMNVFEYGTGNSTLYFASRVQQIISVEHDQRWYDKYHPVLPNNVHSKFIEVDSIKVDYSQAAKNAGIRFDILVIDGRKRKECLMNSIDALSPGGIIILDDAERTEYEMGIRYLFENYFRMIPFWGIAPGMVELKCTAILYRKENCFNI